MKFPKEKPSRNLKGQDEGVPLSRKPTSGGKARIDPASSLATPHTHTESREPREMSDRRNTKDDRERDDNYLSASAVQLEYRKSEPVTEKLMGG